MINHGHQYPFFIVIDDAGFDHALPDRKGVVGIEVYEGIRTLARTYEVCIPLAITARYLDQDHRSAQASPLSYANELVTLLKENERYVMIAYHGLTHEYEGHCGEFFRMDDGKIVPEEVQRKHIRESKAIFSSHGLSFPRIFVPPYHGWQHGVTDRLIAEAGGEYLISFDRLRFSGRSYHWAASDHLTFLPRASMGISGNDLELRAEDRRRIKLYPEKSLLDFVFDHLKPQRLSARIRISRVLCNRPVHSYMTHIGNFCSSSMDFWFRLFDTVAGDPRMHLCRSHEEAMMYYQAARGSSSDE